MAAVLRLVGFSLLVQGCLSSVGHKNQGCREWSMKGDDVCCDSCFPGNRRVKRCGPKPIDLCKPCEPGTYTLNTGDFSCEPCTQCVGQVFLEACTLTSDTKCGCKQGFICGDATCSFCITLCDKGHEPTKNRSCRPCPPGTFNNQGHQMCKPWKTKCPNPYERIEEQGTTLSDIKCANVSVEQLQKPSRPEPGTTEQTWPLVLSVVTSLALMSFIVIVIITVTIKRERKRNKMQVKTKSTLIIQTSTVSLDDPMPLRAIECSFHEAEQEQGKSSESLDTKDSSDQLIP